MISGIFSNIVEVYKNRTFSKKDQPPKRSEAVSPVACISRQFCKNCLDYNSEAVRGSSVGVQEAWICDLCRLCQEVKINIYI